MFNKPDLDKLLIVEKAFHEKGGRLLELLRIAADEMLAKKGDISIYSSHASYNYFAEHIQAQATLIEQNSSDSSPEAVARFKAGLHEAYLIFLPTSDWDDANGSPEIANEILTVLKEITGRM